MTRILNESGALSGTGTCTQSYGMRLRVTHTLIAPLSENYPLLHTLLDMHCRSNLAIHDNIANTTALVNPLCRDLVPMSEDKQ